MSIVRLENTDLFIYVCGAVLIIAALVSFIYLLYGDLLNDEERLSMLISIVEGRK